MSIYSTRCVMLIMFLGMKKTTICPTLYTDDSINSQKRKVHWCFTLKEEEANLIEETPFKGHIATIDKKTYKINVGPQENATDSFPYLHQHGMLYSKGHHITKNQAKVVISKHLGVQSITLSCLKTNIKAETYLNCIYHLVCKEKILPEKTIKQSIEQLESSGSVITSKKLKYNLISEHGTSFFHKNKAEIKLVLEDYHENKKLKVPFENQTEKDFLRALNATAHFAGIVGQAVDDNDYITGHPKFADLYKLYKSDIKYCVTMLAILPNICKRAEHADNLPGLYFWGAPSTGKSFFFTLSKSYHIVPSDAKGVSRYKLDDGEDAYLLDDISNDTLDKPINSSTLRQLVLGTATNVKINGDIQSVQAFVACTSNSMPNFLKTEPPKGYSGDWIENCDAWKRRFITIKLSKPVDLDLESVKLYGRSSEEALKNIFVECYDLLKNEKIKKLFSKYYETIFKSRLEKYLNQYWESKAGFFSIVDSYMPKREASD